MNDDLISKGFWALHVVVVGLVGTLYGSQINTNHLHEANIEAIRIKQSTVGERLARIETSVSNIDKRLERMEGKLDNRLRRLDTAEKQ